MALTVLLAALGIGLLQATGPSPAPSVGADQPRPHTASPRTASASAAGRSTTSPAPQDAVRGTASASPSGRESELPPRGEGRAGDKAIQQVLEKAWPADLPTGQAKTLLAAGRRVLIADATGVGQDAFPTAFPDAGGGVVAPAFTRVRVQAAIARQDGSRPGRAVVHLVWAGADRGGTYTDGRITDIRFRHEQGDSAWQPQPPITR
ncbi:hypothetical protein ACTWJ8_40065 (plasmid) [Streptomyces sp. SDT5-1]|uniref:hypothetical protein n=1 Tax=Streptomyces sp. SDT5-1 TaxID=3406418 RepID=UPI003FD01F04